MQAAQFLHNLIEKVPYKIHTILMDNGVQFTNQARNHRALPHIFDQVCEEIRQTIKICKRPNSLGGSIHINILYDNIMWKV